MNRSSAVCVDASLIVRLLIDPQSKQVRALWEQWDEERRDVVAPGLIHYEVLNALYQYERHGKISSSTMTDAFEASAELPIHLYSDFALHHHALELARRFALPACYDAHYLALSERLGVELWTCDARLVKKVGADFARIHSAI